MQQIKQVNISIHDAPLYFDNNGDPPTGYDIIAWDWVGDSVSYKVIGSYSPNPERLLINRDLINWNAKDNKTVSLRSFCFKTVGNLFLMYRILKSAV